MNIYDINTYPLNQLSKQKISCSCGEVHEIFSDIAFDNLSEKISLYIEKIAPPLSLVSIIYDAASKQKYERILEKHLANTGYRINARVVINTVVEMDVSSIPEDTRIILGIGNHSLINNIKNLAFSLNLPYVVIPACPSSHLYSLTPSCFLINQNLDDIFKVYPPSAVICDSAISVPSIPKAGSYFSLLVSKLVSLFDYQAAALLNAEKFCPDIFDQALAIIDCATKQAISKRNQIELEEIFKESLIRYGALCQLKGNTRLVLGAETVSARIFSSLTHFSGENTGENEFLFARILLRLYKGFLGEKFDFFTPPPSNNERVNLISSLLKIPEQSILKKIRPVQNFYEENLAQHKLNLHRGELFALASEFDSKLTIADKALKKLYLDDGYSFIDYLSSKETAISVAVAPDLSHKFTMLSFMKDRGLLETMLFEKTS